MATSWWRERVCWAPNGEGGAEPPAQGGEEPQGAPKEAGAEPGPGAEVPPAEPAPAEPPKSPGTPTWAQRRIDELTRQRHEAERRAQEYERRLQQLEQRQAPPESGDPAFTPPQPTGEEFDRRVQEAVRQRQFDERCNAIADKGRQEFADFNERLGAFQALGGIPPALVEAVVEAAPEDGHKILYNLGGNLDEAYRISRLSPAQMGAAVAKLAGAAPAPRVSRAPEPAPRPRGVGDPPSKSPDDMPISEWMALREREAAARA